MAFKTIREKKAFIAGRASVSRKTKRIYGFLWKNSSGQVQAIYEDDCNSRQHFYNVRQSFIRSRIKIEDLYTTKPYQNKY